MRASEQILEDRHSDLETKMTLDLHGLHVDEAIAALDRILPEKERGKMMKYLWYFCPISSSIVVWRPLKG